MRRHSQQSVETNRTTSIRGASRLKWVAISALALAFTVAIPGCDEDYAVDDDGYALEDAITADTYKILHGTPGTPAGRLNDNIRVRAHMGLSTTRNILHGLELTDDAPPLVIEGHEYLKGGGRHVKSRKLRIERFMEPDGSKMVQVNVSLSSPFALKSLRGVGKNEYVPSPLLQDTIGNSYWPSGYILRNLDGEATTEIHLDRGTQIRNLNDLPRLSRNKNQELLLLFFVNFGVTVESLSYGGDQPKVTFNLLVGDR